MPEAWLTCSTCSSLCPRDKLFLAALRRTRAIEGTPANEATVALLGRQESLRLSAEADALDELPGQTKHEPTAISEGVRWVVEYINRRFAHLVDERSFQACGPNRFDDFAACFSRRNLPVDLLIAG